MATSNFHNVNASRIFAFKVQDEFDFDDMKSTIISEMKGLKGNLLCSWW